MIRETRNPYRRLDSPVVARVVPQTRRASIDEADAIADVWLRSRHASAEIPPPVHTDPDVRGWIRDILLASAEVWVAIEGTEIAGMMALHEEWIEQLYVAPEHQGAGHGTRLLRLAQSSRDELSLWTFEANLAARRFYEGRGFRQSGPPSSDNEEQAPAILYRWRSPR